MHLITAVKGVGNRNRLPPFEVQISQMGDFRFSLALIKKTKIKITMERAAITVQEREWEKPTKTSLFFESCWSAPSTKNFDREEMSGGRKKGVFYKLLICCWTQGRALPLMSKLFQSTSSWTWRNLGQLHFWFVVHFIFTPMRRYEIFSS